MALLYTDYNEASPHHFMTFISTRKRKRNKRTFCSANIFIRSAIDCWVSECLRVFLDVPSDAWWPVGSHIPLLLNISVLIRAFCDQRHLLQCTVFYVTIFLILSHLSCCNSICFNAATNPAKGLRLQWSWEFLSGNLWNFLDNVEQY